MVLNLKCGHSLNYMLSFIKKWIKWNAKNPDKKININFTVLPYDDMHNKLQSALLSGKGAPDICDIEVGKFPNFLKGDPQLETFNRCSCTL